MKWKRKKAKNRRNSGKAYLGHHNVQKKARSVQQYQHDCRYECKCFSEEERKEIFKDFWELGSWNLQTSFISSCMEVCQPKRKLNNTQSHKEVSVLLKVKSKRVCKLFFLKTLDISQKRYDNVLKKRRCTGVPPTDQRGKHSPCNKIPQSDVNLVKQHIDSFPKYTSHYSRHKNPQTKYLSADLNIRKMYELYLEFCNDNNIQNPVKESFYRNVFNTSYNLSFKRPHTDTCTTCDSLHNQITHSQDPQVVKSSQVKKEFHLRQAEKARTAKNSAKQLAKDNPTKIRAVCFDLEKTLPTPMLTCSSVYYLRQLWTYNFGVHDLSNDQAMMFMWHEGEASRGSQEIGSCLVKYVQQLPPSVEHLIAFSDNAGGQNKNKNIIKFWMFLVASSSLQTVDHKFLISGHSFMECDQDFGIIEKCKKHLQYVFVPADWENVVARASRKFHVARMKRDDFVSVEPMNEVVKNNFTGIRDIQWLRFKKECPYTVFYKKTLNEEMEFESVDLKKPKKGRPTSTIQLGTPLYESTPGIATTKYRDLQQLLQFLPPIHHPFYVNLKHQEKNSTATTHQATAVRKESSAASSSRSTESNDDSDTMWQSD